MPEVNSVMPRQASMEIHSLRSIPQLRYLRQVLILLVFLIGAGSSAAFAQTGHLVEFQLQAPDFNQTQVALVQNGKVLVKRVGGNPKRDMLFDSVIEEMYVIDHHQKTFTRIDHALINQVGSIMESMSDLANSEQGVVADLLKSLGVSGEPESPVSVSKTDIELKIAGIDCQVVQFFRSEQMISELCSAQLTDIPLGEDLITMQKLYAFGEKLRSRADKILQVFAVNVPHIKMSSDQVLPIALHSTADGMKTTLRHIRESKTPETEFQLPANYQEATIPFLG